MLKKTTKYSERNHINRLLYLRALRHHISKHGNKNIIYFDESGFEDQYYRPHGWAPRGIKVHGDITGNYHKRTNLIMAQRGKEWLAPMLFKGGCNKEVVNTWIEKLLLPELTELSLIIMDNAKFHDKKAITKLIKDKGHTLMPLPSYSPDFNPIEQSFAVIKKRRLNNKQTLDNILKGNLNLK